MGSARDYLCSNCWYRAKEVTENFDFGMDGQLTTPVVCPKHGIKKVWLQANAFDPSPEEELQEAYPCPRCRRKSPVWDRETCPKCGQPTMGPDPDGGFMIWD